MPKTLKLPAALAQPDKLLNTKEAAEYVGLRPQTLAAWRSSGKVNLAYIKLPGTRAVRYRRSELDRFLDAGRRQHT